MGCCSSTIDAPDEIIPEPQGVQAQHFYFQPKGKAFKVLKGRGDLQGNPEEYPLWLQVNKDGSWREFTRYALRTFEQVPRADLPPSADPKMEYKLLLRAFMYKPEVHFFNYRDPCYDSDGEMHFGDMHVDDLHHKCKFVLKNRAVIKGPKNKAGAACPFFYGFEEQAGSNEQNTISEMTTLAYLEVKAKGLCYRTDRREVHRDPNDGSVDTRIVHGPVYHEMKTFKYRLWVGGSPHENGGQGAVETPLGLRGDPNAGYSRTKNDYHLIWESPMFVAEVDKGRGWFAGDCSDVITRDGHDPCLAAMIALLATQLGAPNDVREATHPPFPGEKGAGMQARAMEKFDHMIPGCPSDRIGNTNFSMPNRPHY
ncbi:unnamed protein product [Pedinophyceae sp. YPF-701]|nr:unnamed protein product [Pedinophyceae sp. YPF-701]